MYALKVKKITHRWSEDESRIPIIFSGQENHFFKCFRRHWTLEVESLFIRTEFLQILQHLLEYLQGWDHENVLLENIFLDLALYTGKVLDLQVNYFQVLLQLLVELMWFFCKPDIVEDEFTILNLLQVANGSCEFQVRDELVVCKLA